MYLLYVSNIKLLYIMYLYVLYICSNGNKYKTNVFVEAYTLLARLNMNVKLRTIKRETRDAMFIGIIPRFS